MEYRRLGSTDFMVSEIGYGTVELGQDYNGCSKPNEKDAIDLLQYAVDNGINYYDTAAGYGTSERLIGKAFAGNHKVIVATKVARIDPSVIKTSVYRQIINSSIENSCRLLRRDYLDIVQLHSANVAMIADGRITDELERLKKRGYLRFIGATIYDLDAAEAVISDGRFAVVQIPYSLLDRRFAQINAKFAQLDIGIVARSVLMRGGIFGGDNYPPEINSAAAQLGQLAKSCWGLSESAQLPGSRQARTRNPDGDSVEVREGLAKLAYAYVLADTRVSCALVGTQYMDELEQGIGFSGVELDKGIIERVQEICVDEGLLDIRNW